MGENLIGSLFNRAILDTITGVLALVLTKLLIQLTTGVNFFFWIINSSYSTYSIWIFLTLSFLFGHLVDKIAFLLLDHTLFSKHFQNRLSTFEMPKWCEKEIEGIISASVDIKPTKSQDLIDDSKADWITAFFLVKARSEAIQKRADLIANFQFVSNLLMVLIFSFFIIPLYYYFQYFDVVYAIIFSVVIFLAIIFYWKSSVASLARIHTFENIVVYGILIDQKAVKSDNAKPLSKKRTK